MQKIKECLTNLVAIKGLCDTAVNYRSYINDIPGLGNEVLAALLDRDHETIDALWATTQREGIPAFYEYLISQLHEKFFTRGMLSGISTGEWLIPHEALALTPAGIYTGEKYDLRYSDNLSAYIDKVELFINNPAPGLIPEIRIYDLERGILLDTFQGSEATASGYMEIPIEREYARKRLFIGYNSGAVQSIKAKSRAFSYYRNRCSRACDSCNTFFRSSCVTLDTSGSLTEDTVGSGSCGMIVHSSVNCSLSGFVCSNKARLTSPLKYYLASELMIKIVASSRLNIATLLSAEEFDKIAIAIDLKKKQAFRNLVKGTRIEDPVCMECNAENEVRLAYFHP